MPWVRFDDRYPLHRKVSSLSDPAFRLATEAIFWNARELMDGRVPHDDLESAAPRKMKRPDKFVPELVQRGVWHEAGQRCGSRKCPAHVDNPVDNSASGWVIHDYFDYQPTKEKVLEEREKAAQRQKKWRDQQKQDRNGVSNGSSNGVSSASPYPYPSRRDGKGSVDEDLSRRNARADDDDDLDLKIENLLREHAPPGIDITAEWATKVRRQILDGRQVDNRYAYAAAAIRGAPGNYLPTSGGDPSSRTVAEALAEARGEP